MMGSNHCHYEFFVDICWVVLYFSNLIKFHMLINCTPSIKHSEHLDQMVIFVKTVHELCNISAL
jgi:hypothetical protein